MTTCRTPLLPTYQDDIVRLTRPEAEPGPGLGQTAGYDACAVKVSRQRAGDTP